MTIDHVAIWVDDLETMRQFYCDHFGAVSGKKYINAGKGFSSYFLTFRTGGARLELMHRTDIHDVPLKRGFMKGMAHLAISVGDKEAVDALTDRLRASFYIIAGEPRTTGDGYYESVVMDPEGNHVEITI
jgi:lactoylglutathione lyase